VKFRSFPRRLGSVAHLRDLGVHIATDGFGYRLLEPVIPETPARVLLEDRSVPRARSRDYASDLAIVGAIIALALHLDIPVIAEGIEGWQQFGKRRELGCQRAQRHLFSKATPAGECGATCSGSISICSMAIAGRAR